MPRARPPRGRHGGHDRGDGRLSPATLRTLLRGATAGCVGALALAAVLVLWRAPTDAQRATERSLRDSGVVVVTPGTSSGRPFEDVGGAVTIAGIALLVGLAAGAAVALLAERGVRRELVAGAGFAISVVVLLVASHVDVRDVVGQAAVWIAVPATDWWLSRRAAGG